MKYGKIVCGALRVPQNYPGYISAGKNKVLRPTEKDYIAAGYLPIEEAEMPTVEEGKVAVATFTEAEGKIVQSWSVVDTPQPQQEEESAPKKTTKRKSNK